VTRLSDRKLEEAKLATVLAELPGWILHESGAAIFRDYGFREWPGAVLFVALFGAVARLNDFDVDFYIDVTGTRAAVALGAWSFEGVTPRIALLAGVAEELARLNLAEE
jgi:pterin-4a-carbinolamine dehydratase